MEVLFIIVGLLVVFGLGAVGGAVALFVLWPRVHTLERRMEGLERRQPLAAGPALVARPAPPAGLEPGRPPTPEPRPEPRSMPPIPSAGEARRPAEPVELPAAAASAADVPDTTWEQEVGSNWLNKIGVLIVVIGLALGVSYSFTQMGPAGRVATGFAVSLGMLAAGLFAARRERFVAYGHGLVAGGWAGVYFTTFAMHGVDAARVVESEVVGTLALVAVSAAMFLHALRYRSELVAGLTLVVVYVTLAISPLTWFALSAALPIAAAALFVAARNGWTGMTALGIGATYALAGVRGINGNGTLLDHTTLAPYALLAAYWITFELADLMRLLRHRREEASAASLFALNGIGLVGSAMLVLPPAAAGRLSAFTALLGLAYVGSALVRRRLIGEMSSSEETGFGRFTTFHGSVIMAGLLMAWSTGTRFDGTDLTYAWLFEAELAVATGLLLADGRLRAIGGAGIALAALHALGLSGTRLSPIDWPLVMEATTPALVLTAGVIYVNREWLRSRARPTFTLEHWSTWAAAALLMLAGSQESELVRVGFGWLVLSAALVEAGIRRAQEYRHQGYVLSLLSAYAIVAVFGGRSLDHTDADVWIVLGGGTVLAWAMATRLAVASRLADGRELQLAAAGASCIGALLLAFFEWRILPDVWLPAAFSATGYGLLVAGQSRHALLRWQACAYLAIGVVNGLGAVIRPADATTGEIWTLVAAIVLTYTATLTGRSARRTGQSEGERLILGGLSALATLAAAWLVAAEMRESLVTLAWGLIGLGLLVFGFPARERVLRLSGLALLALCILKLFVYDLAELEAVPRIMSFVVLGLVLLGVSWAYTRFGEQIRRYL